MRRVIWYLFWMTIIVWMLFYWTQPLYLWNNFKEKITQTTTNLGDDLRSSILYLLPKDKVLNFLIPSFTPQLKFVLTANLSLEAFPKEPINNLHYSVEYTLLDTQNKPLVSKEYHLKTAYLLFQDSNRSFVEKSFYTQGSLFPSTSKTILINLASYPTASKVALRLKRKDETIEDIGVRNYYLEMTRPERLNIMWERMSAEKRAFMARGNVYDPYYMRQIEKDMLVSSTYRPNGPIGIEGKAYKTRRLFIHTSMEDMDPYSPNIPNIYADSNIHASRYLPQGEYSLTFSNLQAPQESNLTLNIYSNKTIQTKQIFFNPKDAKPSLISLPYEAIVEINATSPMAIEIEEMTTHTPLPLPPVIAPYFYKIEDNRSLSYDFFTPHSRFVRLDTRKDSKYSYDNNNTLLHVSMYDKEGNHIKTLEHNLSFVPSYYDYTEPYTAQSEPTYIYMYLCENVTKVTFNSTSPLLLRLQSRSVDASYPLYSFSLAENPEYDRLSGWFWLRPKAFHSPKLLEYQTYLFKQPYPPKTNPFIEIGRYFYETLLPIASYRGYTMLLKRPLEDNYIRPQSWANIYSKLPLNQKTDFMLHDDIGAKETTPHFIYYSTSEQQTKVDIVLDDVIVTKSTLYDKTKEWLLPLNSVDANHTLQVKATPNEEVFVFMNHIALNKELYFKRHFIAFDRPLHFQFEKKNALESLGFQLASTEQNSSQVCRVQMKLDTKEPLANHLYESITFNHYQIHFNFSKEKILPITHPNEKLILSNPTYLNIGENLSPNTYNITLYPPNNKKKNYLFINHIRMDTLSSVRISKEYL